MFKGNNSESILILKEKFSEIKRNISLIEQKQSSFFNQTRRPERGDHSIFKRNPPRPSSVGRVNEQSFQSGDSRSLVASLNKLRNDKKLLELENEELLLTNERQKEEISSLSHENKQLKKEIERLKKACAPPPCLKQSGSTPKKHRVAFSKDLVQVMHLKENEQPPELNDTSPLFRIQTDKPKPHDYYMKYHPVNKYFRKHFSSTSPVHAMHKRNESSFREKSRVSNLKDHNYSPNYRKYSNF